MQETEFFKVYFTGVPGGVEGMCGNSTISHLNFAFGIVALIDFWFKVFPNSPVSLHTQTKLIS